MRTIFIGDIHGVYDVLCELLDKIKYDQTADRVILTGDLLSRGPDPIKTLDLISTLKLESVQGNHDLRVYNFLVSKKPEKHPDYYDQLSDVHIQYLMKLPPYIELADVICVHAGIIPNIPMTRQGTHTRYLRYTDLNRKFISLRDISKYGIEKLSAHFWTEFGPFGKSVVYGHQVHSMTDIRIARFTDGTACYGIDNGAVFGGKLSALIWETKEVYQVQAHEVYFQSSF